jgi:hypothetical protein
MDDFPVEIAGPPRPVPESLRKRGITGVVHNLKPEQEVKWVKPFFWAFRVELEDRFLKQVPKEEAQPDAKGDHDGDPAL